jgi:ADP-ribose pyrophosphatase YjhB (NUDIX family)
MSDITLPVDNSLFSYRVGAIIIHGSKLLMVKNENLPFLYSVGGRVQFGETSEEAILREIYEETQIDFEIERLAFVHENFLKDSRVFGGKEVHELAFYFLMKPNNKIADIKCNSRGEGGYREELCWIPVSELSEHELYPIFFKTELQNLNAEVGHFVTRNRETVRIN